MKRIHYFALAIIVMAASAHPDDARDGQFLEFPELEKHYIAQIARLRASGYAEMFGGDAWFEQVFRATGSGSAPSLHTTLKQTSPVWVTDGNIPFLIVISEECAPLHWQATRIIVDGQRADAPQLPLARLENAQDVATPKRAPYFIFNVNPGLSTSDTSVRGVEIDIATQKQRGLTFAEGVALLLHYPDTTKYRRGVDENGRECPTFGRLVFLSALYGGACPCDRTAEELVTFRVRRHVESGFTRGYFTSTIRRDMTPNYEHFIFPSCDPYAPEPK